MTDQELKDLVAGLAIAQARTDAQLARTDEQLAKTDAQIARIEAQLAQTIAQMAISNKRIDDLFSSVMGIGHNNGLVAESYFYTYLQDRLTFGNIKYDSIQKNTIGKANGIKAEFDIVMFNGNSIALIETKYKAHEKDIDKLIETQLPNFKTLFPKYAHYHFYLGIASFAYYDKLEEKARQNGIGMLKIKGENVSLDDQNLKAY